MIKKQCDCCGMEKIHSDFSPSGRHKDGLKSSCKICNNAKKRAQIAAKKEKMRVVEALNSFKTQGGEKVPSRDHSNYKKDYVPPVSTNRNDGNKHIKSRGFSC